jgi:hypothetical protein
VLKFGQVIHPLGGTYSRATRRKEIMSEIRLLTPKEAEAVVDNRIQQFGLGSLPHVEVTPRADGSWNVKWDDLERTVAPMTLVAWHAWLTENVGSLDAGDLETTES